MPVILNQDNTAVITDIKGNTTSKQAKIKSNFSPKFFNKTLLTGKGGTSKGLLNEANDPKSFTAGYPRTANPYADPGTEYNGDIKLTDIPCNILLPQLWDHLLEIKRPDISDMTLIAKKNTEQVYLTAPIMAMQIEENRNADAADKTKKLSVCIRVLVFSIKDPNVTTHKQMDYIKHLSQSHQNVYYTEQTYDLFDTLKYIETDLSSNGYTTLRDNFLDFIKNYSLYDELCKSAERWMTHTDDIITDMLLPNIVKNNTLDPAWTNSMTSPLFNTLSRLEKFNIPLDQYESLYKKMSAILNDSDMKILSKANLNLELSNTLQHMNNNKDKLCHCPCNVHTQTQTPYSTEQMRAIESESPLTLIQSGAGTGKSTVILGRINHMIANGIRPQDITVLSFTNAAADHIRELNSTIHSMTIASMLHTIYSANFPKHQLSSLATIINSIDIYQESPSQNLTLKQKSFMNDFKYKLNRLMNHNEYTKMNNFVEQHIDDIIFTLDMIEQTSLELEAMICYQKMESLTEPDETKTKHLIIDEVQDNSISEFIYSIKYTDKHQCSLYIVGDCSQTLYEFRASNPKTLNILEKSQIFDTYKLETNYRSNQEILDFANILLGKIEANKYADIRLKANDLKPVTLASFKETVQLQYEFMENRSANTYDDMLMHSIAVNTHEYVKNKLLKGEQVCILAHKRKTLDKIKTYLEKIYPNASIVSIVPKRQFDNTIFSKFIAHYWKTIQYMPPMDILTLIHREMIMKADRLSYRKSADDITRTEKLITSMIEKFRAEYGNAIANWQNQVLNSMMTQQDMLNEIKKLLISFEIKTNGLKQALTSAKNNENKMSNDVENAHFILSTIHSAKGLEFDNVIVFYEDNSNMDEENKRMYYVALTRAKKSEFICAYGTLVRPKIEYDYEMLLKELDKKEQAANAANTQTIQPAQTVSTTNTPDTTSKKQNKKQITTLKKALRHKNLRNKIKKAKGHRSIKMTRHIRM